MNPAYGPRVCPHCGCFGMREDVRLYCARCGEMDTGHNIAFVCLARTDDTEIKVSTPYREVKEILHARLRLSKQGSGYSAVNLAGQFEANEPVHTSEYVSGNSQ